MKKENSYDSLLETVAKNVKKHRNRCKITQEGMADHGFDCRYYQRVESGKYSMNLYTLHKLAKVFKTNIKTFFYSPSDKAQK